MSIPRVKKVLIIDDDEKLLMATERLLNLAGYEVATRSSEFGTLAAVTAERPDVVLLDLNMPVISGDRLAALLLDARQMPPIVVIYSGADEQTVRERAARCGAHGCILKGCSPAEFLDQFKRIVAIWSLESNRRTGVHQQGSPPTPEAGSLGRRR